MQILESPHVDIRVSDCDPNATLVHLLRSRAESESQSELYSWLADGEVLESTVTCGELDRRARAVAATLVSEGMSGERALLLYGPGLEYAEAFFGCLYAGVIAVPAGAPRSKRDLPRLESMLEDSGAKVVLSTGKYDTTNQRLLTAECWRTLQWIDTSSIRSSRAEQYEPVSLGGDDIAYLQYTSGSSATPKGVIISHGNLMSNLRSIAASGGFAPDTRALSWLPHFHDMGLVYGFLQPIFSGFPAMLMAPNSFIQKPLRWLEAISRYRITHTGGPNFAYDLCVQRVSPELRSQLDLSCWKVAFNGAEPVRAETIESFAEAFSLSGFRRNAFYPVYGLAEATLKATSPEAGDGPTFFQADALALEQHRAEAASPDSASSRRLVASGRAELDIEIAIVDPESCSRCLAGQVGEIWIHGLAVAAGYWNRPEESAATFNAVIAGNPGKRWLRTGDLGFLRDGHLFVTGRRKDCIIIRGQNHYPQDIERTLEQAHPALVKNASIAFSVLGEREELLVVVAELNRHYDGPTSEIVQEVRRAISEGHELQTHAVVLVGAGHLPRTSSGKVRRQECKRSFLAGTLPSVATSSAGQDPRAAETAFNSTNAAATNTYARLESWLLATAAALLRVPAETMSVDQPLTALGLDSLAAVQLSHQMALDLGIDMEPGEALGSASIRSLARKATAMPQRESTITPVERPGRIPLSMDQKALWLIQQRAHESGALNIARAVHLGADVDPMRLRDCLQQVVSRHPALHGYIANELGEQWLEVTDPACVIEAAFTVIDARDWSADRLDNELIEQSRRAFILHQTPLFRIHLYQCAGGEHLLLIVIHHIVADFWSMSILVAEVAAVYAGETLPPAPNADGFYEHIAQEQRTLAGPQSERLWEYWRTQLPSELTAPLIPGDRPRSDRAERESELLLFDVTASLSARLRAFARKNHATLYTVLLAAFEVLLCRYTGQTEFVLGTPSHGRDSALLRQLIGYFVKALPVRADLRGDPSFEELHQRVAQTISEAFAHDGLPFAILNERLGAVRSTGGSSLMDVSFVMQRSQLQGQQGLELVALGHPGSTVQVGMLQMQARPIEKLANTFELVVTMAESGEQLYGSLVYDSAIFDRSTMTQFAQHFIRVMETAMDEPNRAVSGLSLLTDSERLKMVNWNNTEREIPAVCVHELFEAQAQQTPHHVALVCGNQRLTYGELNARANQLAHFLRGYGVGPEIPVAICCERSPELLIAIIAVAKAGGIYVPLDASYPAERLAWMLDDSQAPILLTQRKLLERLPSHWAQIILLDDDGEQIASESMSNPSSLATPQNSVFVVYTSGSTGQPKGVIVEHRGIVRLVTHMTFCEPTAEDAFLLFAPVTFDASTLEIWVPLTNGSRLVIAPPETGSLEELAALVEQANVTALFVTSGLFHQLVETHSTRLGNLRYLMTGGDIVSPHYARLVTERLPGCVLIHAYGPAENTTFTTCYRIEGDPGPVSYLSLGSPISNTTVFILDDEMEPVPAGVAGELYTGGVGLARGYHRRPELTAERFLPNVFSNKPGERLYRTGDRVRWSADGKLQFLGRLDSQVKLRGFRIELEEIQAALMQVSGVKQAVVLVREDNPGDKRLVAYVAAEAGSPGGDEIELREQLSNRMPEYMIPAAIIVVQDLPLTPTGKIDRKALPAPEYGTQKSEKDSARTPVEEILVGIWSDVLKTEHVGIHDSFFDLGGHSLLATQLISRTRATFGVELPFRALFESPTVAAFAEQVEAGLHKNGKTDIPPIVSVSREQPLPLSFAQQRLWFLEQLDPGSTAYNSPGAVRLNGSLDPAIVQRSLTEIVRRHEVLRTTFPVLGDAPIQHIAPPSEVELPLIDLSGREDREQRALELAREEAVRPFHLSDGPLLRTTLVRLEPEAHLLLLTVHHSVCDAWSINILIREFTMLYETYLKGEPSPLPELPVQYADFAFWQRQWLTGDVLEGYLSYWRHKLKDMAPLQLRIGKGASDIRAGEGRNANFELEPGVMKGLQEVSRQQGATLFMTMLAAFEVLMHRYSGQTDFAVGAPVAGRNQVEIENLIGFFVNMLPLRADLSGEPSFDELLQRVRTTTLEAYSHQALPLEKLIEEVKPPRINGRPQIFQVTFALQNEDVALHLLPGGDATLIETDGETVRFGLVLWIFRTPTGFRACWRYNSGVFTGHEIERLNQDYTDLLQRIAENPSARISELAGSIVEPETNHSTSNREEARSHAGRMTFVARKRNAVQVS